MTYIIEVAYDDGRTATAETDNYGDVLAAERCIRRRRDVVAWAIRVLDMGKVFFGASYAPDNA